MRLILKLNYFVNLYLICFQVVTARPGTFGHIDYSKADVWAVGAMAYEIFSGSNPFYSYERGVPPLLRNATYKEKDLPVLSSDIPLIIRTLIQSLLYRSTSKVILNLNVDLPNGNFIL